MRSPKASKALVFGTPGLVHRESGVVLAFAMGFSWDRTERLTEWQVIWLAGSHREANSIPDFLAKHGAQ